MQSHVSATFQSLDCAGGVCIADGYGVQVRVRRKYLVVNDGIGRYRRERSFAKALVDIQRLVILGHEGAISLEALRWMNDAGISFLQIDRDGELIASSANYGLNNAQLRRAQALAQTNKSGLEIARYLVTSKLRGQQAVLARPQFASGANSDGNSSEGVITDALFPRDVRSELASAIESAQRAESPRDLLLSESAGAAAYWSAWQNVTVRFAKNDEKSVPLHWRTFGQRSSPITASPRLAANPANALLNYLYAILEAETRIACLACGLDPGLGIVHTDQGSRDSLALDIMEAVRPQVDAYLLELLARRTFTAKDFTETRKGVCRVLAPVTHMLAETRGSWFGQVAPVTEEVTRLLLGHRERAAKPVKTPLTHDNHSRARDAVRRKPKKARAVPAPKGATCQTCGAALKGDRLYCDDCLAERRGEQLEGFEAAGPAALAQLRAEGRDPTTTPEAKHKLGRANAERRAAQRRWEAEHEMPDPEVFRREILPKLQGVPLSAMMVATGLSLRSCSRIRRGQVPHAMHWEGLRSVATVV